MSGLSNPGTKVLTVLVRESANVKGPVRLNDRDLGALAGYGGTTRPKSVQRGLKELEELGYISRSFLPDGTRLITVLADAA